MGTWYFSWNYTCASVKRRMPGWLKDLLIMSPQFFKALIQGIALLISWLFRFHYYSSHKWIFDILNEQCACMPKTGGEMARKCSWEWQRTWEDMVCETIWVVFVKDLEAVAVSLLQRINSPVSVALSNDIWLWGRGGRAISLVGQFVSRSYTHTGPICLGALPSSRDSGYSLLRLWMRKETVVDDEPGLADGINHFCPYFTSLNLPHGSI